MEKQPEHSFFTPSLGSGDPLNTLMKKIGGVSLTPPISNQDAYWQREHYKLNHSRLFQSLSFEKQDEIVIRLNRWSLELIYFIEKFGLNYGAKMIALGESEEEKSLYSLFAGDEVRHRLMIEPFLLGDKPTDTSIHPLLDALANCLRDGTKEAMTFTIQVILEGFGLMHYSQLQASCQNFELKKVFELILKDEVGHHGMGVILTKKSKLNNTDREQIHELTSQFVHSLIHADWVQKSIEQTTGGLTRQQKEELKEDTSWAVSQKFKIDKMSQLIGKVGQKDIYERLVHDGAFKI